jgi:hypothetical protein
MVEESVVGPCMWGNIGDIHAGEEGEGNDDAPAASGNEQDTAAADDDDEKAGTDKGGTAADEVAKANKLTLGEILVRFMKEASALDQNKLPILARLLLLEELLASALLLLAGGFGDSKALETVGIVLPVLLFDCLVVVVFFLVWWFVAVRSLGPVPAPALVPAAAPATATLFGELKYDFRFCAAVAVAGVFAAGAGECNALLLGVLMLAFPALPGLFGAKIDGRAAPNKGAIDGLVEYSSVIHRCLIASFTVIRLPASRVSSPVISSFAGLEILSHSDPEKL